MADRTIGELPALSTMEGDTLIPVEHDGSAKSMAGTVLQDYIYENVENDVQTISQIIAVGPQGPDGVSPTLSASKTGKVTTIYFTDAEHPTPTVLATLNDGIDGLGIGDMVKATYDTDDDGIVDNAAQLGGQGPSYYIAANEKGVTIPTLEESGTVTPIQRIDRTGFNGTGGTLGPSAVNGMTIFARNANITFTLAAATDYDHPFRVTIVRWGTYTVTIRGESGVTINGVDGGIFNIQHQYKAATLVHISNSSTGSTWWLDGDI